MYKLTNYIKLSLLTQRAACRPLFAALSLSHFPHHHPTTLSHLLSACPGLGVSKKLISAYVFSGVFRIYPVMLVVSGVF